MVEPESYGALDILVTYFKQTKLKKIFQKMKGLFEELLD